MDLRLVIALLLALHPALVRMPYLPAGGAGLSCCPAVVVETCCGGEAVAVHHCGRSGGECECRATDGVPAPERREAPAPRSGEFALGVPVERPAFEAAVTGAGVPKWSVVERAGPAARSHNTAQALLGVWRT